MYFWWNLEVGRIKSGSPPSFQADGCIQIVAIREWQPHLVHFVGWTGGRDLNLLGTAQQLKGFDWKVRPVLQLREVKHASPRGERITISP